MSMARAHKYQHTCPYGCCGDMPRQRFLGTHKNPNKTRGKRLLAKRDRQRGKKEIDNG